MFGCSSETGVIPRRYFFFPEAKSGCHDTVFWLGAAAIVLILGFLGFLTSRLPLCSPLAISLSLLFDSDWTPIPTVRLAQDAAELRSSMLMARSRASITIWVSMSL